jgi:hypothetical protein
MHQNYGHILYIVLDKLLPCNFFSQFDPILLPFMLLKVLELELGMEDYTMLLSVKTKES